MVSSSSCLDCPLHSRRHLSCHIRNDCSLGSTSGEEQVRLLLERRGPPTQNNVSRFTSFICAGGPFGTVIAMPASTYLCEYPGWESVFYVFGAIGCLWFIVWALVIHDGPDVHPRISENEKMFLMVQKENTFCSSLSYFCQCSVSEGEKPRSIPWCGILSSPAVWAIAVAHVTQNFGFYVLLTELPTYLKNVLGWDLKSKVTSSSDHIRGVPPKKVGFVF